MDELATLKGKREKENNCYEVEKKQYDKTVQEQDTQLQESSIKTAETEKRCAYLMGEMERLKEIIQKNEDQKEHVLDHDSVSTAKYSALVKEKVDQGNRLEGQLQKAEQRRDEIYDKASGLQNTAVENQNRLQSVINKLEGEKETLLQNLDGLKKELEGVHKKHMKEHQHYIFLMLTLRAYPGYQEFLRRNTETYVHVGIVCGRETVLHARETLLLKVKKMKIGEGRRIQRIFYNVFVVGPDKKLKLSILYSATTGRNFDEVLRVIDSLQLTATKKVATPVDWKSGGQCMVIPSVKQEELGSFFPKGVKTVDLPSGKQYLRLTPQP